MHTISRNVRLPAALDADLRRFCERTRRQEAHTVRAVVELFLADGHAVAERRLSAGVWDVAADVAPVSSEPRTVSSDVAPVPSEPRTVSSDASPRAVDPDYIVTGRRPRRRRTAG